MAKHMPLDLDRVALKRDLNECPGTIGAFIEIFSTKRWRNRSRKLKAILDTSKRLSELLDDREDGLWLSERLGKLFTGKQPAVFKLVPTGEKGIYGEMFTPVFIRRDVWTLGPYPSYPEVVGGIALLVYATEIAIEGTPEKAVLRTASPFEWFVGNHLARLFERHFKIKATIIRDQPDRNRFKKDRATNLRGPFIDFAQVVLRELGIVKSNGVQYAAETIAKARVRFREL